MMQMISRPTRAIATTSVRRMTGGNSPLLSGTGVPSCALGSWRSPGKGFVGGDLAARGLAVEVSWQRRLGWRRLGRNNAHNGFPPPEAAMKRQKRRRGPDWHHNVAGERGFHRAGCERSALDKVAPQRRPRGTAGLRPRLLVQSIQRCASPAGQSHDTVVRSPAFVARGKRARPRQRRPADAADDVERGERADARLRFHPAERRIPPMR